MKTTGCKKIMFLNRIKAFLSSNYFAFSIRFAFVVFLLIGERFFLGPITHSRGKADLLASFGMMLIVILAIDRFSPRMLKKALLFSTGAFLIFFHLLAGLYYRFFNSVLPFDIFHQWNDFFVIGGYSAGLISGPELLIAIIMPAFLLVLILLKPLNVKPLVFVILLAIAFFGWNHRVNRALNRPGSEMSSLPDFIHRQLYYWAKVGTGESRYLQIVTNVEAAIPRNLKGYKAVKDKGIMVEPVAPGQDGEIRDYNVIFILMESIRSYECGFLGASQSFTPRLDKLAEKALVFDNFYANGSQTVRAELASLCSVYTNPIGVPDYLVNPNVKLISFPEILGNFGYDTLWFSGYTADFHNKRAFLSKHGISKIYDRDVLPRPRQPEIGWGMNDCEMFDHVYNVLEDSSKPFFAQITTLSNHVAKESIYPTQNQTPPTKGSGKYIKYTEGIYYTDYAVSQFIEKILNSDLAEDTIVIAMGDHGLWLFPDKVKAPMEKLEIMFRVPLCIWGPEDIIRPGHDGTIGSQVDLSPTLMDYLNIKHQNTFLGQSLLNQDIPANERYVVTLLGSIPHIRVGDTFSLSKSRLDKETRNIGRYAKVEKMNSYEKDSYSFMRVKGDVLHGDYTTEPVTDERQNNAFSQRLDDIVFLTSYGLYMNAYQGVRN